MTAITCRVEALTSLTPYVYKVLLKPEQTVSFSAGQYLNFVMGPEDKRPFSIASSPNSELIELQIGASVADSWPMQVIDHIKANQSVTIEAPLGSAQFREDSTRPILLLAGGTGFSYIKSIFEYLADQKIERPVTVYWGLREPSACYELEQTTATINRIANAEFIPVVEQPNDDWQGKVGLVHEVAMADIDSFDAYDIYLAGRFEMVGKVREDFVAKGAVKEHMYADAFAFI